MKKLLILMCILLVFTALFYGCVTTKTASDGTVTKTELDKTLISAAITEYGPALLPVIQSYANAYLEYKVAADAKKTQKELTDLQNKVTIAKEVLQAALDARKQVTETQ